MDSIYSRTERVLGSRSIEILKKSKVAIFGIGGVGGFAAEALARAGVGHIAIIDFDKIDITNINRQVIALHSTVGRKKVDVMEERLRDINPNIIIEKFDKFVSDDSDEVINFDNYDYIVDAIDHVKGKLKIIESAKEHNRGIISSMGMGNKVDPQKIVVSDISKTHVCPLAKTIRKAIKDKGIKKVKCVFSTEEPKVRVSPPGSLSFVPSVAGLTIAKEVVMDLISIKEEN